MCNPTDNFDKHHLFPTPFFSPQTFKSLTPSQKWPYYHICRLIWDIVSEEQGYTLENKGCLKDFGLFYQWWV